MGAHAILAPSSAHRWMTCKASLAAQLGRPDRPSKYADEGTAAHTLYAWCLERGSDAVDYAGVVIPVMDNDGKKIRSKWPVNSEMIENVQTAVDRVRGYLYSDGRRGMLFVERRVDFSNTVGYEDQTGTADTIIISANYKTLQIHDLKYGRGVQVDAEKNEQMMTYALGALEEFELIADIERVVMCIHQPRTNNFSEWECSVEELKTFGLKLRAAAKEAMGWRATKERKPSVILPLNAFMPTESNCQFCKASGDCFAQDNMVADCADDFDDVSTESLI